MNNHSKVITVSLNPSIDLTLWTDGLDPDKVNRIVDETRVVAGKGINVSRVIESFGMETLGIAVVGEENYRAVVEELEREAIRYEFIKIPGEVRENITLRYADSTIKLNRKGPHLSAMMLSALAALIQNKQREGDFVVFSGSLPENTNIQDYLELMMAVRNNGGRIVVDSDMLTLEDYRRVKPYLVKPNIYELQKILRVKSEDIADIVDAAREIRACGVENVLVSIGERGLVLVGEDAVLHASVPRVALKSTVGAGDSALAGYLIGLLKEFGAEESIRLAAACGTDCVRQEHSELAARERVFPLLEQITVDRLI
ncbi:MAG: 1-phosphofructokinase family hexose kinase [Oscillospiraceae bacterium]|nr:1-phosphofructokinase family hexose kinase [Oscillospiraceae bacterium]